MSVTSSPNFPENQIIVLSTSKLILSSKTGNDLPNSTIWLAKIKVIKTSTVATTPSTSAGRSYTVLRGDTLQAIAAKFGVPMETIMKRNKLITPTAIKVGQVLVIP